MKTIPKARILGTILSLLLLCSCATKSSTRPPLPADASINKGAGRGDFLLVMLHLKDGKELLFAVDTGMPITTLDSSLESKLGKCIGTNQYDYVWYGKAENRVYTAPKLYLANTRLVTGKWVFTDDLSRKFITENSSGTDADRRVWGILGMDCLENYCIQLDFAAEKMRFLDPNHLKAESLGKAFPITLSDRRMRVGETLAGVKGNSWIDTGDPNDGALVPELFDHQLKNQKDQKGIVTREFKTPAGKAEIAARVPNGEFGGLIYTNLVLLKSPDENIVGLQFLARHLVTLNFPKRTMYLKQTNVGSLADGNKNKNSIP
jgi:hypothetical protein